MSERDGIPQGETDRVFWRFKVGEVIEVGGVPLKVEWAQKGRVLLSTPNTNGAEFKRDGRITRLTFAEAAPRMPASANT